MSVKAFPKHKDESKKEQHLYFKNVLFAEICEDCDCPELSKVSDVMALAEELHLAGWKVKVEPFEDCPLLHVRASKKTKRST